MKIELDNTFVWTAVVVVIALTAGVGGLVGLAFVLLGLGFMWLVGAVIKEIWQDAFAKPPKAASDIRGGAEYHARIAANPGLHKRIDIPSRRSYWIVPSSNGIKPTPPSLHFPKQPEPAANWREDLVDSIRQQLKKPKLISKK